ncbi:peptidyl-arginine deiminase family protein [Alcanivorax hongdengensis A-11-3]|uniref:Peptidyl-arginine deiminase family protein n=1 Tax=Alcanivorax hongdengensis A-11-3 TaxID=1177179 RepID=L0WES9_9GAMM|nr:agmatine deiminase family protein [Alcanivorax hongdengensis]EKF75229.1 peptidyl-arginine deiminase family protein [Alcanivorax hongdengensis A-11-3]
MRQLLPEWHPQWGVLLAWPDSLTDWADHLADAQQCYLDLMHALLDHEGVLLVCRDNATETRVRQQLAERGTDCARLRTVVADYNDTWARDFGPIAVADGLHTLLLDYTFTGWGGKFDADKDNRLNRTLPWHLPLENQALVLEGGAIDTDGQGNLLTTRHCLRNPNRNPSLTDAELEASLKAQLGVEAIWWLEHGELEGDDTDAHVDTLARFVNAHTVAYVQCTDPADSHYASLNAMERELQTLADRHGLTLVPLPLPVAQYSEDGERLPATYANFLISNDKILLPIYRCDTDQQAIDALQAVAGARTVVPIACRVLIEQHGSLHCVTMQLPQGALGPGKEESH